MDGIYMVYTRHIPKIGVPDEEYYNKPEVKEKQKEYQKNYNQQPEVKERIWNLALL